MGTENTYWFQKSEMHFICTPFSKFFLTSHLLISKCFNFLSVITAGNKAYDGKTVVVWHIVISSVAGFIMGILTSCIVMCCCRLFSRRKPQTNSQPQAPRDSSIYQELDLNKMNSEDNYQVLRQNVTNSEPGNESVYMDLNQTARDDDNQYQSLT